MDRERAIQHYIKQVKAIFPLYFGSPAEVVSNYIEGMDPEVLCRKITFRRRIFAIAIIALIAILIGVIVNLYWDYSAYRQDVESIVVEGETIIY